MRLAPLVALAAAGWVCLGDPATAQTVRGRVVDAGNAAPIEGAALRLLGADDAMVASALTAENGAFSLLAPAPGSYRLAVERIGYAATSLGPFEITAGTPVDVMVEMELEAIALDSIEVEVSASERYLRNSGFYQRQELGFGQFIERSDIEATKAINATDVLERKATGVRTFRRYGFADIQVRAGAQFSFNAGGGGSATCSPLIYLNGSLVAPNTSIPPNAGPSDWGVGRYNLDNLPANNIEAIEIYAGSASAPAQYARSTGAACGVVLIWTRH